MAAWIYSVTKEKSKIVLAINERGVGTTHVVLSQKEARDLSQKILSLMSAERIGGLS